MSFNREEISQYIQKNYGLRTRTEMATSLGISIYRVRKTIKELIKSKRIIATDTSSRRSSERERFLIDNYERMTRAELARALGESDRWVKRQIRALKDSGKIQSKRAAPAQIFSEKDWTSKMKSRAIELRRILRKTNQESVEILNKEFGIELTSSSYQYWMMRWGFPYQGIQEWLNENLSSYELQDMIDKGMRIENIAEHLGEKFHRSFNEDQILLYAQSKGIKSFRIHEIERINQKARKFSKEWLQDQVNSHVSLKGISEKMGVSETLVKRRISEEGIELVPHRIKWSNDLESLRNSLLQVEPLCVPEEDLHQMILGWIFGDGFLDSHGRLVINHSPMQLDYLYLKARILRGYLTNVVTVPRQNFSENGLCIGGKEQLGISCPGLIKYKSYINPDGSKNFEKIAEELNELGWACVFMDDGSYFSGTKVLIAKQSVCEMLENKYIFGPIFRKKSVKVQDINAAYLIPGMARKIGAKKPVGKYWENKVPELFNPQIDSDLSLSFLNSYLCDSNPLLLHSAVQYYHQRGFPYFSISDQYLHKEFEKLKRLDVTYLEKNDGNLRFIDVGNSIYRHFMQHMVEAKYRSVSPKETFDSVMGLMKVMQYSLHQKSSILPGPLYRNLMHFNGGVAGFPCGIAKAIVTRFSHLGDVVVDPCAGWGGRMLGVVSAGRRYVSYEPWTETYSKLQEMTRYFDIDAEIHNEDFNSTSPCRLIFTSPPFLDLEVYGHSFSRDQWDFLMNRIFREAEEKLFAGGHLILDLPSELLPILPTTALRSLPSISWHGSSRSKKPSSALYVWQKS